MTIESGFGLKEETSRRILFPNIDSNTNDNVYHRTSNCKKKDHSIINNNITKMVHVITIVIMLIIMIVVSRITRIIAT